jgi:hypothetical protein
MTRLHDRIIHGLDAAAESTGIPKLILGREVRRRHFRWLPIVALVMATAGMGLALVRTDLSEAGYGLIMGGFTIAVMLPILGPLKPWGSAGIVDEFDRRMRTRAFLAAFASVTVAAMLGIWLLIGLALLGRWPALTLVLALRSLAFYLIVLYSAVPTLHASWSTDPIEDD